MTPLIECICYKDHSANERQDFSPVLTVYERKWGWCVNSGGSNHEWTVTEPLSLDEHRRRTRARRVEAVRTTEGSAESPPAEARR